MTLAAELQAAASRVADLEADVLACRRCLFTIARALDLPPGCSPEEIAALAVERLALVTPPAVRRDT